MRVLFVTIPENTHLYSMVPTAWAFWAAGHEVRVASTPSLTDTITRTGLTAVPVGKDSDIHTGTTANREAQETETVSWSDLDAANLDWETELTRFQYGAWGFAYYNDPLMDDLVAYARHWRPDLVVWDALSYAGGIAAHAIGVPHARFLSFSDVWGAKRRLFLDLLDKQPADRREDPFADWLGGKAREYGKGFAEELVTGHWTIDQLPERLTVRAAKLRLPVRFTPYNGPAVIPDWLREPTTRRRVCLSLGTANTERFGGDYVSKMDIFDALSDLDVEVVAALLPAQRDELGTLPDNARVVQSVPLHALLPSCSAAVHHGGFGTYTCAVHFGVPALALATPVADQVFRCQRLAESGAGIYVPHTKVSAEIIREKVGLLLSDPSYTTAAKRLRDEAAAHPTPYQLVPACEQLARGMSASAHAG
ncbi:MAG: activator-dependent family glycosyltransferase [Actinocatenispora sp.]